MGNETPQSPIDWDQLLAVESNAVAAAIDAAGMLSVFTTAPVYMATARAWVPTGKGTKTSLGLTPISSDFEPSAAIFIRPGYEEIVAEQRSGLTPAKRKPTPGAAGFDSNSYTAEQLVAVFDGKTDTGYSVRIDASSNKAFNMPPRPDPLLDRLSSLEFDCKMALAKVDSVESVLASMAGDLANLKKCLNIEGTRAAGGPPFNSCCDARVPSFSSQENKEA